MSPNRNLICGLMRYQTTNNMSNLTQLKELAESMDHDELVSSLVSLQTKVDHLEKEVSRHRLMAGNLDEENKKVEEEARRLKMTCIGMDEHIRSLEHKFGETVVQIDVLEEQIKQKYELFEEINEILGVDKDEPVVEMVRDYVMKYGKD